MLNELSAADAQLLREFLARAHYGEEEFKKRAALQELPKRDTGNLPELLEHFRGDSVLDLLVRWFFLGVPVERQLAASQVPESVFEIMLNSGMLVSQSGMVSPSVMLTPGDECIFASDTRAYMEAQPTDVVVWPNPTSRLLHQFTIRRPFGQTLDLGAGCGLQAILGAKHSVQVTATDLNPRAAEYVRFNARLNGVTNVECLTGDTFVPVRGRSFDLILANPPFFVTPSGDHLYCENSMELDSYCRRIVREAPGHLNEGGYLQMVFEWVEISGQTWQDRIREWLDGTGCDAWIFRGYAREAAAYARERIRQTSPSGSDPEVVKRWMDHYRQRAVEKIHGGILAMRRRTGRNWVRIGDMPLDPGGPFGDAVWQAFAGMDFLERHGTDEEVLATRPRLSADVLLERQCRQVDGRWETVSTNLRFTAGIPANMRLEAPVADFIAGLDGRRSLKELAADLSQRVSADLRIVEKECVVVVRKLMERRFLCPEESDATGDGKRDGTT